MRFQLVAKITGSSIEDAVQGLVSSGMSEEDAREMVLKECARWADFGEFIGLEFWPGSRPVVVDD